MAKATPTPAAPKQPLSPEAMTKRKRTNKRILTAAGFVAVFLLGIAAGGGGSNDAPSTSAAAIPTSTVTVTTEAKPAPTVTPDPVIEYKVPSECIVALDRAESVVHSAGDMFSAISQGDLAAVNAIDTDDVADNVQAYNAASSTCRAA